jgi:hypothetical protein
MPIWCLAIAFVLVSAVAQAQSPYVVGTIGADISRFGHTDSTYSSTPTSDSEVISGSVRVGTSVGQNWGVELEFVRSGNSHGQTSPPVPLPFAGTVSNTPSGAVSVIPYETDVRQSHYDFDTVAWVRQAAGRKVEVVYLGGVAFSHQRLEISQTFPTVVRALLPVPANSFRTTIVDYSTRPLVGVEARIGLTSHVRLIPGLRLQGLTDGWLLRPYAGLGWFF